MSTLSTTPDGSQSVTVVPSPITPRLTPEDLEAIRAMLMKGMPAKSTKEADKEETVEVLAVEGVGERTQPLSFLTLNTVEGIVGTTDPDESTEQSTWEAKVENFMRLSDTYSTRHTISGETCYMVDRQLYKDILLAVAARRQNAKVYEASVEQLERHIGHIEDSRARVADREREAIEEFALTVRNAQNAHRDAHHDRMKAVLRKT
jgi:hypothetical protein